ncbi:hypothetical protein KI387_020770 [Taxus chinensis]|uniref:Uncharacterized protein n=1 Tax=Taxus chinensis TaxID=29808 RepID=A0AA38G9J8_TAXCH|nr:hypothetical protein KI387_020770 [Taxus chinensis]
MRNFSPKQSGTSGTKVHEPAGSAQKSAQGALGHPGQMDAHFGGREGASERHEGREPTRS